MRHDGRTIGCLGGARSLLLHRVLPQLHADSCHSLAHLILGATNLANFVVARGADGSVLLGKHADAGARRGAQLVDCISALANDTSHLGHVRQQAHGDWLVCAFLLVKDGIHDRAQRRLSWALGLIGSATADS